jgi:hypothetical protein
MTYEERIRYFKIKENQLFGAMCEYLLRVNPDDDFVRGIAEAIRRDPERYPTKRQAHWISIKHNLAARKREERHQPVRPQLQLIIAE